MLTLRSTLKATLLGALVMGMSQGVTANGPGWGPQTAAGPWGPRMAAPAMAPRQARIPAPRPWTKRYIPPRSEWNFYRTPAPVAYRPVPVHRPVPVPGYHRMAPSPPMVMAGAPRMRMPMATPQPYHAGQRHVAMWSKMPPSYWIARAPRMPMVIPGPYRPLVKAPRPIPKPPMWAQAPRIPLAIPGPYRSLFRGGPPMARSYLQPPMIARAPRILPRPPAMVWAPRPIWQVPPRVRNYPPMMAWHAPAWRHRAPWRQARTRIDRSVYPHPAQIAARHAVQPPPGPYASIRDSNNPEVASVPAMDPRGSGHQAAFGAMVPANRATLPGTSG